MSSVTSTAARESADPEVARPGRKDRWQARWHGFSTAPSLGRRCGRRAARGRGGDRGGLRVVARRRSDQCVQHRSGPADVAQKQLKRFEKSLTAGDRGAAQRHLRKAEQALTEARGATAGRRSGSRSGCPTPGTRSPTSTTCSPQPPCWSTRRTTRSACTRASPATGRTLFKDGQGRPRRAVIGAQRPLLGMAAALDRAESELIQVDGDGPLGDEALEKKKSALKQIRSVQHRIAPFTPVINALPSAVGAEGTKRYLVAIMNPAEMRASGGAPLSMALVVFKKGKLTIPLKGTTSSVTKGSPEGLLGDSPQLVWPAGQGRSLPACCGRAAAVRQRRLQPRLPGVGRADDARDTEVLRATRPTASSPSTSWPCPTCSRR